MPLLEVKDVRKAYRPRLVGPGVETLRGVSFAVEQGEFVDIMGESGSGKTTLLNILATLDKPTSGQVLLQGKDLAHVRKRDLAAFRRERLGFVFQDFNLLDALTARIPTAFGITDFLLVAGCAALALLGYGAVYFAAYRLTSRTYHRIVTTGIAH